MVTKKGACEVCSMNQNIIFTKLQPQVKHLEIFCDLYSSQELLVTKLTNIVTDMQRPELITGTFPMSSHSYVECNKTWLLLNTRLLLSSLKIILIFLKWYKQNSFLLSF